MRNKNQFDINWFYKYFLEKGGAGLDVHTFGMLFQSVDLNSVLSFLDAEFSLTRLHDKEGNFIKIVE
jgi:hypothetical protein